MRSAIDVFKAIGWVLFGLAIVAFAVAIFLARDRRSGGRRLVDRHLADGQRSRRAGCCWA